MTVSEPLFWAWPPRTLRAVCCLCVSRVRVGADEQTSNPSSLQARATALRAPVRSTYDGI
jgi:hypothetical protein